ncbi:MAG: DUF3343 domain-containing protein [Clostridia bacterium]
MRYIILAFKSQSEAAKILQLINAIGVKVTMVNTPYGAKVGCGISLRIDEFDYDKVKKALESIHLSTFAGYFSVAVTQNQSLVTKL